MIDRSPGVWVTGHMRSGTSMMAGLFAAHGVWWGTTGAGTRKNPKGNYEHRWLRRMVDSRQRETIQAHEWEAQMRADGWEGGPWGFKVIAFHEPVVRPIPVDVVVLCYRDKEAILRSCEEFGNSERYSRRRRDPLIDQHWNIMDWIMENYPEEVTVVPVDTAAIVAGYYSQVFPAFNALGVRFNQTVAREWIDPTLWHHWDDSAWGLE